MILDSTVNIKDLLKNADSDIGKLKTTLEEVLHLTVTKRVLGYIQDPWVEVQKLCSEVAAPKYDFSSKGDALIDQLKWWLLEREAISTDEAKEALGIL